MSEKKTEIIEKTFKILEVEKKNKNHRNYPPAVIDSWMSDECLKDEKNKNEGFDLEYAVEDQDIYHEFTKGALSCGVVNKLEIKKGWLHATVRFKLPELCNNLTEGIYSEELNLDNVAVVPKGKGSVKNQTVQDDYELYGFNLISLEESSFFDEEKKEEKAEA